jgi:hypothetical protein
MTRGEVDISGNKNATVDEIGIPRISFNDAAFTLMLASGCVAPPAQNMPD